MTSHDTAWVPLPDGKAAASTCRSRLTQSLWWLPASSGCTARGWGATGRGSGVLRVGGAFVQYAQPLASGSRPSWSRATRAGSSAGPESHHDRRDPAQMAGRERWRRTCEGGAGLCRTNHGLSLLRGSVSTVLTLTSPTSVRPAGIVGILRFFFGVQRRCACDVSTMDTSDLPDLFPSTSPSPPGPPACPGFPSERVPQKPRHSNVSEVRKQQSSLGVRPRALHCEHNHQRSPGNTFSATQSLL